MSAPRKKSKTSKTRTRKNTQGSTLSIRAVAGKDISIQREADYIIRSAIDGICRCVSLGALVFFSTESGDAWMLDPEDGLALCLARDREVQPRRIIETETSFGIEWDRNYTISDDAFTTVEKKTGRISTISRYPIGEILVEIERVLGG